MTIIGVNKVLKSNINKLDDYNSHSLKAHYFKNNLKIKSKSVLEKLNKLKNYGKKKGEQIFYASKNKGTIKKVEKKNGK